jgi:hypothetical protein
LVSTPVLAMTSWHSSGGSSMFLVESGSIAGAMNAACFGRRPGSRNSFIVKTTAS